MAISTLLGSGGPPRESISVPDGGESDVWAQTQLHRQQVLDSLFSKRTLKGKLSGEGTSGKGNQVSFLWLSYPEYMRFSESGKLHMIQF